MKKETKRKVKRAVGVTSAVVSTAFVGMMALAKLKKGQSVYDDDLKEKNPLEGKKVKFVENENDKENAMVLDNKFHIEFLRFLIYPQFLKHYYALMHKYNMNGNYLLEP